MLTIGQTAPNFTLRNQNGSSVELGELVADGDLILYFYPADFSPACTTEACVFRDSYDKANAVPVVVARPAGCLSLCQRRF